MIELLDLRQRYDSVGCYWAFLKTCVIDYGE